MTVTSAYLQISLLSEMGWKKRGRDERPILTPADTSCFAVTACGNYTVDQRRGNQSEALWSFSIPRVTTNSVHMCGSSPSETDQFPAGRRARPWRPSRLPKLCICGLRQNRSLACSHLQPRCASPACARQMQKQTDQHQRRGLRSSLS